MENPDSMLTIQALNERLRLLQDRKELAAKALSEALNKASFLLNEQKEARTVTKRRYFERKFAAEKKNIIPIAQYTQNLDDLIQRAMDAKVEIEADGLSN